MYLLQLHAMVCSWGNLASTGVQPMRHLRRVTDVLESCLLDITFASCKVILYVPSCCMLLCVRCYMAYLYYIGFSPQGAVTAFLLPQLCSIVLGGSGSFSGLYAPPALLGIFKWLLDHTFVGECLVLFV